MISCCRLVLFQSTSVFVQVPVVVVRGEGKNVQKVRIMPHGVSSSNIMSTTADKLQYINYEKIIVSICHVIFMLINTARGLSCRAASGILLLSRIMVIM